MFRNVESIDLNHVYESKMITQFDDRLLIKVFGYKNVMEYYEDASSGRKIGKMKFPRKFIFSRKCENSTFMYKCRR